MARRRSYLAALLVLAASACLSLGAQTFPGFSAHNTWTPTHLVTISLQRTTCELQRVPPSPRDVPIQVKPPVEGARGLIWSQNALWSIAVQRETGKDGVWAPSAALYRWDLEERRWDLVGVYRDEAPLRALPDMLAPLGRENLFLGFREHGAFRQGDQFSPVAIFRRSGRKLLHLESLVVFPTAKPLFKAVEVKLRPPSSPGTSGQYTRDYTRVTQGNNLAAVKVLDHAYAVPWSMPGWIWFIDATTAAVRGPVKLIPGVREEDLHFDVPMDNALLALQPTRDGRLLAVTREPGAVLDGARLFDFEMDLARFNAPPKEREALFKRWEQSVKAYPELCWWHINPETLDHSPAPPPRGIPRRFKSVSDVGRFSCRFLPDGNLAVNEFKGFDQ